MHPTFVTEQTIAEVIESVWDTVLGLRIDGESSQAPSDSTLGLSVCVHITGAWNGAVLFWPTDRFALQAAATLFALPEADVTPADIQDGMAELCNIVAGNLKSVLPGPSALSLPTVTRGLDHEVFVRRTRLAAQYKFNCNGEPLSVRLLQGIVRQSGLAAEVQLST